MVYVQWYSLYVRQDSVIAWEFEHRSSLTSDQNSLVSSHRTSLAITSYSMLNVLSLCAYPSRNKILAATLIKMCVAQLAFWRAALPWVREILGARHKQANLYQQLRVT